MKNSRSIMARQAIMFWIIVPIIITIALVAFIEIAGRLLGGDFFANAGGIMLLAGIVPIAAAHVAFLSAIAGVVGLFLGLPLDRKFIISLIAGLAFGIFMLHRIYLS